MKGKITMPVTNTVSAEDVQTTLRVLAALVEANQPDDNRPGAGGNAQITRAVAAVRDALEFHAPAVVA